MVKRLLSVPPLPVPAADRAVRSPEGLLHYDAVRLFAERATASERLEIRRLAAQVDVLFNRLTASDPRAAPALSARRSTTVAVRPGTKDW